MRESNPEIRQGTKVPRGIITEKGKRKWGKRGEMSSVEAPALYKNWLHYAISCSSIFSANLIKILLANVQLGKERVVREEGTKGAGTTYWDLWLLWWLLFTYIFLVLGEI